MTYSLKGCLIGLSFKMMKPFRAHYLKSKLKRNRNKQICLLCNNCTGGVILHDLGLPFNTPTINMGIRNPEEFLYFVENIGELIHEEVHELDYDKYNHPAGYLLHKGNTIDVVFTHYNSFEEGRRKWLERMKRVDLNNIYILYEGPHVTTAFLERFSKLPYKKVVLSNIKEVDYPFYHGYSFYKEWKYGKILEYKSLFSVKRYLDEFDYVSFFNE